MGGERLRRNHQQVPIHVYHDDLLSNDWSDGKTVMTDQAETVRGL